MKSLHCNVAYFIVLLLCLMQVTCFAHYPYPMSKDEKEAADKITRAVQNKNQSSVATLAKLLDDENSRIQTAALLGIMRLTNEDLDFEEVRAAISELEQDDATPPFLSAAVESTQILLDEQSPEKKRISKLIALTESKEGYRRRMAVEAIRPLGDKSVLKALENLANDSFGDHDDRFDMRAVARVAFDVWWSIRSKDLTEEQRLPVLIDILKLGEPYRSRWCDAACDLIEKEGQKAVSLLIPAAKDGDRRSKLWARRTLRAIGGEEAVSALLEFCVADLDAKDRLVRQSAANSIFFQPDKRVLPAITTELQKNKDPIVRRSLAAAMGQIDDKRTVSPLKAALKDPDEVVRAWSAAGLVRKGFSDGDAILLDSLELFSVGGIAAGAMSFISDQEHLAERIADILQKQPGKEIKTERQMILFKEVRSRILRTLASWDAEKLLPMSTTLKPVLEEYPKSGWTKRILDKLSD